MAYQLIEDFRAGIDLRKSPVTAKPGTLRTLTNGFINAGGEIERSQRFGYLGKAPAATFGLSFDGSDLVVFGSATEVGVTPDLPPHTRYVRCVPADGAGDMTALLDAEFYGGAHYVIAGWSDGSVKHFYDGAEVTDAAAGGTNAHAFGQKVYAVDGSVLRFSGLNNPTGWTATGPDEVVGAGVIDVSTEDTDGLTLTGIASYYGQMALFGRKTIQIWSMDPDPLKNQRIQTLGNIGLIGPHAAAPFGGGDVLFLSDTGIRSLRARNSSNAASVTDIGSAIDRLVLDQARTVGETAAARALVDPQTGRFWLIWGKTIYVLTHFPDANITAWSTIERPAFTAWATTANARLVLRDTAGGISVYGAAAPDAADNPFDVGKGFSQPIFGGGPCVIETPFLDVGEPATDKLWQGLDVSVEGAWDVYVNIDYGTGADGGAPDAWTKVASVTAPTWWQGRIPLDLQSTHVSVRFVSVGGSEGRVAAMALHYEMAERG